MRVYSKRQLYWKLLIKYKTPLIGLLDNTYVAIHSYYLDKYAHQISSRIQYIPELADCDNFAFAYKGLADVECNAVGIIYGMYNHKNPHCWNIGISEEDDIVMIEPQEGVICAPALELYRPIVIII